MTIEEARKLLDKDGDKLTDEEVLEYINSATILAEIFFDTYSKATPEKTKEYLKGK